MPHKNTFVQIGRQFGCHLFTIWLLMYRPLSAPGWVEGLILPIVLPSTLIQPVVSFNSTRNNVFTLLLTLLPFMTVIQLFRIFVLSIACLFIFPYGGFRLNGKRMVSKCCIKLLVKYTCFKIVLFWIFRIMFIQLTSFIKRVSIYFLMVGQKDSKVSIY